MSARAFDLPLLVFHLRNVSPFFGALALFAESVETTEIATAATDGRRLLFNPGFMASHRPEEQLGILVHELLHAALRHVERRSAANPALWNIAADIVVNGIISQSDGLVLPKSAVRDRDLENFPVEEVYQILVQRHPAPRPIAFIGSDLLDPAACGPGSSPGADWNSALAQAAVIARMGPGNAGNLPQGLELAIARSTAPPLDWRTLLWRHLTRTPVDFTSFDRRFFGEELYLDALDGESVRVAVCVDTSGSIGTDDLGRFLNEIRAILAAYPATCVELHTCDAALRGPWKLDCPECPIPKILGGGGTSFVPFFEELERASPAPDAAVYLTDGHGTFPKSVPRFPVLWVVSPGGLASSRFPFGETARMVAE